jgi:hypothetical protein
VVQGHASRAAYLGGAAESLWETLKVPPARDARVDHDRAVQSMRAALGEEAFDAAWARGRVLSLEQAITLALEGYSQGGQPLKA